MINDISLLNTQEKVIANVHSAQIQNSHSEKLLGVIIDNKLSFEENIKTLCGKAGQKFVHSPG